MESFFGLPVLRNPLGVMNSELREGIRQTNLKSDARRDLAAWLIDVRCFGEKNAISL